LRRHWI
jgi:hypothetical protein